MRLLPFLSVCLTVEFMLQAVGRSRGVEWSDWTKSAVSATTAEERSEAGLDFENSLYLSLSLSSPTTTSLHAAKEKTWYNSSPSSFRICVCAFHRRQRCNINSTPCIAWRPNLRPTHQHTHALFCVTCSYSLRSYSLRQRQS